MSQLFEEIKGAMDDFKAAHLNEIKSLKARIDEFEAKGNRMGGFKAMSTESGPVFSEADEEHKNIFLNKWLRKGNDSGLYDLEAQSFQNSLQTGSDPDGGYAVPAELDRNVSATLVNMSAMRRLANVKTVTAGYFKLFNVHGSSSGWVGEADARPETDTPKLVKLTPYFGEIYANPAASQTSLDDIGFDAEAWLQQELTTEFAKQESAFVNGNGVKKPRGLLSFPTATTADATRPFGTIETIKSGNASGFPAVSTTFSPFDVLEDMVSSLKAGHRNGACWLMNAKSLGYFRKVKTAIEGEYVYTSPTGNDPAKIWGFPVELDENMPDIGADALPVAFGNFKTAFTITDIFGTRMLRDPYTNKPNVNFYTTRRTGSMLEDSEAVKFLLISA